MMATLSSAIMHLLCTYTISDTCTKATAKIGTENNLVRGHQSSLHYRLALQFSIGSQTKHGDIVVYKIFRYCRWASRFARERESIM